MLTRMTDEDWAITVTVFRAAKSRRGEPGHDDRKFLEALHYFTLHSIAWRALPLEFGNWNSVWKRFWRLSRRGVLSTSEGGRDQIGMVAAIKSVAWPRSNRNRWPRCIGIRTPAAPLLDLTAL